MGAQLKGIGEVVTETWGLYRQRAVPILAVVLLTSLLSVFLVFIFILIAMFGLGGLQVLNGRLELAQSGMATVIWLLPPLLVGTVLVTWSLAAVMAVSVDEDLSVTAALRAGWRYFMPLAWVGGLYMGIVLSGLSLLLIPGLILGFSLCLCFYALLDEDLRGMDAVLASRLYMRGHWWNTFVKFLSVWLVATAVGLVPYVGPLFSYIFTPFLLLYMVVVYRDLRDAAGEVNLYPAGRWVWGMMATAGIILPLLGLIGLLVTLEPRIPGILSQIQADNISSLELMEPDVPPPLPGYRKMRTAPEVRRLRSVDGSWIWHDPVGNTASRLLDVTQVSVKAERQELQITVILSRPIHHYYLSVDEPAFAPLLTFYLDTDVDRQTGGRPMAETARSGYERAVDVLLEARPGEVEPGLVQVGIYALEGGNRQSLGGAEDIAVTVSGSSLKIRLPYGLLGIAAGDTLRMCYREISRQEGSGLARDKLIPVD